MIPPDPARRRRWPRRLAIALGVPALLFAGTAAWLLRDPTPHFLERRSRLAVVRVDTLDRDSAYTNERVRLEARNGLRVDLMVRSPRGDSAGGRPLFVILGGYETGQRAAALFEDTHGMVIAALSYPYDGPVRLKGLAVVEHVPAIRRALLDTPPATMLALDYLLSRTDVDTTRVELLGASFGTSFGCIVGALDTRVTRVWSLHGAGMPYTLISHNLRKSVPFAPARVVVAGLANLLASGPRLAPERWAGRIAPRPFVMINAAEDERMPREAVMALYESAGEPKELVWLPGVHVQSNRKDVLQSLVNTVLERAARMRDRPEP
jgi:hypothetical protein